MSLKPCPYRHVGEEGHILCDKIKVGDREVSPNICRVCPVSQINCTHLRATLDHQEHPPVIVRWGNGKTQVWEDDAPSISFRNAACAEKVTPIDSQRDCAGCALRQPLIMAEAIAPTALSERRPQPAVARAPRANPTPRPRQPAVPNVAPAPMARAASPVPPQQPTADARTSLVAQKIIQLQEWLTKQKNPPRQAEEESAAPIIQRMARPVPPKAIGEEKRVGWTD